MSYETKWLVDKRVLYVRIYAPQTASELDKMSAHVRALCEAGIPFVYVISDSTDQVKSEFKLQDILEIFRGSPPPVPTVGWSLYVSPNALNRFFFSMMSQLNSGKNRAFSTIEEAIAFVQQVDDTLPAIPNPKKSASV